MLRMNEASTRQLTLRQCLLLCVGVCLLFSLTPLTDYDGDGFWDSFVTDGLLAISVVFALAIPMLLVRGRLLTASLASPGFFSYLIVPPPIF